MTIDEALSKAMKFCSTKEYAPSEMKEKLAQWGISNSEIDKIIETLRVEKFIDEFRMARYFANDKLKFNKWGKIKIKFMMQQKKLSGEAVSFALEQINPEEYLNILLTELRKKRKTIKDTDNYHIRAKLYQFASGRGFEGDLISKMIDKVI